MRSCESRYVLESFGDLLLQEVFDPASHKRLPISFFTQTTSTRTTFCIVPSDLVEVVRSQSYRLNLLFVFVECPKTEKVSTMAVSQIRNTKSKNILTYNRAKISYLCQSTRSTIRSRHQNYLSQFVFFYKRKAVEKSTIEKAYVVSFVMNIEVMIIAIKMTGIKETHN